MALTRKFLTALGLEGDKVDEIISAHTETVEALKEERDTARKEADSYKAEAGKVEGLQKELETLKEAAEKDGGNAWKVKYDELSTEKEKLQKEFDDYKSDITAKEVKANKEKAYRGLLKEAGILEKSIDAVIKVTDFDKVELDEDGKIKDADKAKDSIKEEWAGFIAKEGTQGADTAKPPAGNGGEGGKKSRAAEMAAQYMSERYGNSNNKEG